MCSRFVVKNYNFNTRKLGNADHKQLNLKNVTTSKNIRKNNNVEKKGLRQETTRHNKPFRIEGTFTSIWIFMHS